MYVWGFSDGEELTLSPRVGQSRLRTLKGTRLMQLATTLLCHLAL